MECCMYKFFLNSFEPNGLQLPHIVVAIAKIAKICGHDHVDTVSP